MSDFSQADTGWAPLFPDPGPTGSDQSDGASDFRGLHDPNSAPGAFQPLYESQESAASHPAEEKSAEEKGYEAGFAKGQKDGQSAAAKSAEAKINQITNILTEIENLRQTMIKTNEAQIMDLIGRLTEKIVYHRLETDAEIIKNVILEALAVIPEPADITISISPEDYEYIETVREDFFTTISGLQNMSVLSHPSIKRGGCKIQSTAGNVDARIETRLTAIRQTLTEMAPAV